MGTGVTFLVDAEPGLTEVTITIDGALLMTKEVSPGKYSIATVSPAKAGTYPVEVKLKNILSQITTKSDAEVLTVKESVVVPVVPPPPVVPETPKVSFKNVTLTSE